MPPLHFPPLDASQKPVRPTTMVVADTPINRMVVGKIAAQAGLKIIETSSADALAHLNARAPSLVILDCAGGVTPHFETLMSAMAAGRQHNGLKVIMIHARDGGDDCLGRFSPDACISAPVTSDSLLPVIRKTAGL